MFSIAIRSQKRNSWKILTQFYDNHFNNAMVQKTKQWFDDKFLKTRSPLTADFGPHILGLISEFFGRFQSGGRQVLADPKRKTFFGPDFRISAESPDHGHLSGHRAQQKERLRMRTNSREVMAVIHGWRRQGYTQNDYQCDGNTPGPGGRSTKKNYSGYGQ